MRVKPLAELCMVMWRTCDGNGSSVDSVCWYKPFTTWTMRWISADYDVRHLYQV